MPLLEIKKLTKTYHTDGVDTPVLHGVSFSINAGEFVAIMGPSGSGKSTLLHILGFLDHHSEGTYAFHGKEIHDYSEDERARVRNEKMGFVFQSFNLLARTSVFENVRLPLMYSDIKESTWDARTHDAIKAVGLTHRLYHSSSSLSGGERQRVAIARAIVTQPSVVFADEPTGNLDSKSGQAVMQIIQNLNAKGHTIILITHETYTAQSAKRIIRISDGKIVEDELVKHRRNAKSLHK
jgi:putative ABC transport system ATP-binding protein